MRVMRDKAELSDKADQLEHLVVQLQGETDTIGTVKEATVQMILTTVSFFKTIVLLSRAVL